MEFLINDTANYVTIRMRGPVTGAIIINALTTLTQTTGYHYDMNRLWDFRDADFSQTTFADIQKIAKDTYKLGPEVYRVKAATVVSNDINYGICRQYDALRTLETDTECRTFRDIREARKWIQE